MSFPPPAYQASVPGVRDDDPPLSDIVPAGERIIRVTRPTDPKKVGDAACCTNALPFILMPCFWPHLLVMWPCFLCMKYNAQESAKATQVILTDRAVYLWNGDFKACPCSCTSSGVQTGTVPLERITNVGIHQAGSGCANKCVDLDRLVIETAGSGMGEITILGAEDGDEFKRAVMAARQEHQEGSGSHRTTAFPASQPTGQSSSKRITVRLADNPNQVGVVRTTATWTEFLEAIKTKFNLPQSARLQLQLTEARAPVEALEDLEANDDVTVIVTGMAFDTHWNMS